MTPLIRSLGIDIGGSAIKAAWLGSDARWRLCTSDRYTNPSRETLTNAIRACVDELGAGEVQRIGLCLPGRMNAERTAVEFSVNIPALNGLVVTELLESAMGHPVEGLCVRSDANAAGYDWTTEHPIHGRTAAISLGTGVGLSVLDGDQIRTIGDKGIGHLGLMDVGRCDQADRTDRTGARNTLESYIGAPALKPWRNGETLDLSALEPDDPPLRALVHALRIVHAIYQPDRVALLGGVGLALGSQLDLIRDLVNDGLTPLAVGGWTLHCGDSGYHAGRGAAKFAAHAAG